MQEHLKLKAVELLAGKRDDLAKNLLLIKQIREILNARSIEEVKEMYLDFTGYTLS